MVKRASTATLLSVISAGPEDRARKVGVAYSNTSRFLMLTSSPLHQRMIPYVSHPVCMEYIDIRDRDLSGPRDVAILCAECT